MSGFAERFRSHSNAQLLHVLQNRKQYQYAAVKAAEDELKSRNLDDAALQEAKQQLNRDSEKDAAEKQKREEIRKKIKAAGVSASNEVLNFAKSRRTKVDKGIIVLSIVFALQFLWLLSDQMDLLTFMFTDPTARWDLATLSIFFPLLLIPFAILFFFLRKKAGWFLLTFHICFSLVTGITGFVLGWLMYGQPFIHTSSLLTALLFYGVTGYYVCTGKVRERYSVSKQELIRTLVVSAVIACCAWYAIFSDMR